MIHFLEAAVFAYNLGNLEKDSALLLVLFQCYRVLEKKKKKFQRLKNKEDSYVQILKKF